MLVAAFCSLQSHDDTDNVLTEEMKEKRLESMKSFDVLLLDEAGKSSASAAVAPKVPMV